MTFTKRLIAVVLALIMLLSCFAGCGGKDDEQTPSGPAQNAPGQQTAPGDGNKPSASSSTPPIEDIPTAQPPELSGAGSAAATSKEPVPGVDFKELSTGEANDWGDIEPPLFNPLGSKALYSGTDFDLDDSNTINPIEGYEQQAFTIHGDQWDLDISNEDYTAAWLRHYAKGIGAQILPTTSDYLAFVLKEDENTRWYIDTDSTEDGRGCRLVVTRARFLPAGEELTIKKEDLIGKSLYLYTERTPGKKQSAEVTMTRGGERSQINLYLSARLEQGEVRWDTSANYSLNIENGDRMTLDDLPFTPAPLLWEFRWGGSDDRYYPEQATFVINEIDSVQEVEWGTATGGIRIVGAPPGSASAYTTGAGSYIRHDGMGIEVAYGRSVTSVPDAAGNAVIPLPAGYYEIQVGGNLLRNGDPGSTFRLIPVSAGKITEVSVPEDLKSSYEQLARSMAAFDKQTGGIDILDAKDNGDTATVSLLVNDPAKRDVFPEPGEFVVTEYGVPGEVIDVKREPAQSNVVLVLDSSGSMGEFMAPTVEAAKRFVESLPDQTSVTLVQFAQQITTHKGTTKEEALAALDKVRSIGATSLYDATDTALSLLSGKDRAFAVVFSDGADSREPGIDGVGSKITKEQIIDKISKSGVTVLTIGFGEGHDPATLIAMGEASSTGNGAYFAAADETALDSAFAAVAGKFGNQFTLTYNRPTVSVDVESSVPAASVMLDISGSMAPYLNNIRALLHDFVLEMPKDTLMQFAAFSDGADYLHASSYDRAALLQAVGMSQRAQGGGTDVKSALQATYEMLSPLPTIKKNAVFISDEALDAGQEAEKLFGQLKDGGIRTLFLSIAEPNESLEKIYSNAAELSGGEYLITTDLAEIQAKVQEMLSQVNVPLREDGGMQLGVSLDCRTEDNSRMSYSAVKLLDPGQYPFAARTQTGQTVKPNTLAIRQTDEPYILYDAKSAQRLTGGDAPDTETRIAARIELASEKATEPEPAASSQPEPELESSVSETVKAGFAGSNKVANLTVNEAYFLDLFKGLTPAKNKQFLALDVEIEFDDKEQEGFEAYQIPTILNHFFVSVNGNTAPASKATWMANTPLVVPGEVELEILPGETKSGVLMFLVDRTADEYVGQMALHFYDTSFGHIEIPITGTLPQNLTDITELPKSTPSKITDAFSLAVTGLNDLPELSGVALPRERNRDNTNYVQRETSFRVLEGRFDSNVQALLNIDPMQRFLYAVETDHGPLVTKMSEAVYNIPMGFSGETLLAPGANNPIRMPYQMANELAGAPSYIFGDLSNGLLNIPVTEGTPYATGSIGETYSHEYFDVTINSFSKHPDSNSRVILDFTITDKKDGYGLGGVSDIFYVDKPDANNPDITFDSKGRANVKAARRKGLGDFGYDDYQIPKTVISTNTDYTGELLYGAYEPEGEWAVYDGMSRRGLLVFYTGAEGSTLKSDYFPELALAADSNPYPYNALLAQRQIIEKDEDFEKKLDEAVSAAVTRYEASRPKEEKPKEKIGLAEQEVVIKRTPAPGASAYGAQLIESVRTDADFRNLMNGLKWIPGGGQDRYMYSPEATLTQGWGTEAELTETARTLLARMGCSPKLKTVSLTDLGEENYEKLAGYDVSEPSSLNAISYHDTEGKAHLYIPLFRRDITELEGLCYLPLGSNTPRLDPLTGELTITVRAELTGEKQEGVSGMGDFSGLFGSLLADEDTESTPDGKIYEEVTLFKRDYLSLPDMSAAPIDISYISAGKSENGTDDIIIAAVDTPQGTLTDTSKFIDTSFYNVESVTVRVYSSGCEAVHTTILKEGEKLTDVMHALAWNQPELPDAAIKAIEAASAETVKNAGEVDDNYSIVRWNTRETAMRLMRALTLFDIENEAKLGVVAARVSKPISFMVTARSNGTDATLSVDLMNHHNEILFRGENEAHLAYNTMLGFYASQVEAEVLPDGRGRSYLDVWGTLPNEAGFIHVNPDMKERELAASTLREKGFPELLCKRLEDNNLVKTTTGFIIPTHAGKLDGETRWAWLEVDRDTGNVVSVFDTGERMGMASYLLGFKPKEAVEFTAGAMIGIACSHFSVAAYALEFEDYDQIMKSASALAIYAYKSIAAFKDGVDKLQDPLNTLKDEVTGAANSAIKDGTGIDVMELYNLYKDGGGKYAEGKLTGQLPQPTFTDGFKAVVEAYFGVKIE